MNPSNAADRETTTSRIVNAPRDKVFKAWSDPTHLARWWGPNGFTNTFHEFDFRQGGAWHFVMHGPDGNDYDNQAVYREIVKPERIVLEHTSVPHFQVTATFEDIGGKTKVTFRQVFDSSEVFNQVKAIVVPANEQNLDRLEAELKRME